MKILKGISYENFDFFNFQKISTFSDFENFQLSIFFFEIFFRPQKIFFSNQIFFKVHLLCWVDRFKAIPGQSEHSCGTGTGFSEKPIGISRNPRL